MQVVDIERLRGFLQQETGFISPEDVDPLVDGMFANIGHTIPDWDAENNLALENGYACHPSTLRGYNWCFFTKEDTEVWPIKGAWHKKFNKDPRHDGKVSIYRFHTLEDALKDKDGSLFKAFNND